MQFVDRHIGPREAEIVQMLDKIGFSSLEALSEQAVPRDIFLKELPTFLAPLSEKRALETMRSIMAKNHVRHSLIGQGFYGTVVPTPIRRNILENPLWYTPYTPYQPEISQGRLESLFNYQTLICELTGFAVTNASLLDEASATAEAALMAWKFKKSPRHQRCFIDQHLFPQNISVLRTRLDALQIPYEIGDVQDAEWEQCFAMIAQYPNKTGYIDPKLPDVVRTASEQGVVTIAVCDLLGLTLVQEPSALGFDMACGSVQRFGIPMGYGGPHAAYLAAKKTFLRLVPGRIVGQSINRHGHKAYRLSLQTREQHIRREKATSNVCTAQALLANMAAMYAVYHGPAGLTKIARSIHQKARMFCEAIQTNPACAVIHSSFFDTVCLEIRSESFLNQLKQNQEFWFCWGDGPHKNQLSLSFGEDMDRETFEDLLKLFGYQGTYEDLCLKIQDNQSIPFSRKSTFMTQEVFHLYQSETELNRYMQSLCEKDLGLCHSMIPLGSCTMKLNAASELDPLSWESVAKMHPFCPEEDATGYQELIRDLEEKLCALTGFDQMSLQPNSGAQGEFAGLLAIRYYLRSVGQEERDICLIPESAHGTNPASAVMAGFKVLPVRCDAKGNVDMADLKTKVDEHQKKIAALMITYPSTHGVFEEDVKEICAMIHAAGGQVYMDGANLNAQIGLCLPGQYGADVAHLNLHKTFCIPHGGGGPGVGPIGVKDHLAPFLPHRKRIPIDQKESTQVAAAPYGSACLLTISWMYIHMMGSAGLRKASQVAILHANYMAKELEPYYKILFRGKTGLVAHEFILDLREVQKNLKITVEDIAKRLMDYGFHAPTMAWPVPGTLMVEPTESESKVELDRFVEAMVSIAQELEEIRANNTPPQDNWFKNAPHTIEDLIDWTFSYPREKGVRPVPGLALKKFWPATSRVEQAYGDRNLMCACPPMNAYQNEERV